MYGERRELAKGNNDVSLNCIRGSNMAKLFDKPEEATTTAKAKGEMPRVSPEIERFLRDMGKGFGQE